MTTEEIIPEEMIRIYIERRQSDWWAFRQALDEKDFSVIENIGHKLKGNGVSFGFPELSVLGESMETAAQDCNFRKLQELLESFELQLKGMLNRKPSRGEGFA